MALPMQNDKTMNYIQKVKTVWLLSVPAILAQLTMIIMQYIDAAMVGELGANASASIGIVSTSTWLLGGLCTVAATGFSVQLAQQIGAGDIKKARLIMKHGFLITICFSIILMLAGIIISASLPRWLGASDEIYKNAYLYFLVYVCSLPVQQLNKFSSSMLQSCGNMKIPSLLNAIMCGLDVIFNLILIQFFGVLGAAFGTAMAQAIIGCWMFWMACFHFDNMKVHIFDKIHIDKSIISSAARIAFPIALEHTAVCGAMIAATRIIAPLGTIAIAANSFAVTAESLCYMPGYGIAMAATTLVGQSIGANKKDLAKSYSNISIMFGTLTMTGVGILMYFLCPVIFQLFTPDFQVQKLAVKVLRIELLAEPLYAVSIVASGALRGAGDTFIPSLLNLFSIWCIRLILSLILVNEWGLFGVWFAKAVELCIRGLLMLYRQQKGNWLRKL